uniref:Uncharacterized protein n=1 Tax=Ananas comosus var. bracteatus TaxID=296719 RepID=A0A6V7NW72_ANACO|nr:unnamed protein product [Ananas comosus var. bracteatus]
MLENLILYELDFVTIEGLYDPSTLSPPHFSSLNPLYTLDREEEEEGEEEEGGKEKRFGATSGLGASSPPSHLPWCLKAWTWSLQRGRSSPLELGLELLRRFTFEARLIGLEPSLAWIGRAQALFWSFGRDFYS